MTFQSYFETKVCRHAGVHTQGVRKFSESNPQFLLFCFLFFFFTSAIKPTINHFQSSTHKAYFYPSANL